MNSKAIRKAFLDFFISKQHTIVDSAPMVVKNDPTLMFTNAGMNQFKDIFLGNQAAKAARVADTQKCLRVSGKHNDLEEVGHDTYHHTMFEMLGNWSFGDYFKEEAIDWAWEFLHDKMGIAADRMYATVFEGSEDDNLGLDVEAQKIWLKHLPADRVLNGSKKDNFWEMGDTGPCGPCSELHVDLRDDEERAKVPGVDLVNQDHPLVIEIWNLVFIQFNRKANGSLEELPAKHVDTGMGFERLCMIIQGKKSNYDTDVFQPVIGKLGTLSNKKYGENEKDDIAMRVIADHLRAIAFAIADGQLPSNNKAGYVIRRILRRAVRYGYTFLGFREPFIYQLVETLKENMGDAFPELQAQQVLIEKVIKEEEESFLRTLSTGIKLLDELIGKAADNNKNVIEGKDAFVLYDTYGFPLDLTELIARENGLSVDEAGFNKEMEAQKNRSRNAAQQETDDWVELIKIESTAFLGYDQLEAEIRIARYRKVVQKKKSFYQLVFDQTPFYGEAGGQVGDQGYLEANGVKTPIFDTQKENNLTVHLVEKLPENPEQVFKAVVNGDRRKQIANNHTATHLLHAALREVLGTHVEQKGSLVNADHLRFDFSHFQKVTDEELAKVEALVNKKIRENANLEEKRAIPMDEAKELGAMMLFGEKYGDAVRVIKFGESVELCGGTHAEATGQIGLLKIVSEGAVAAGIRRIEAITAARAEKYVNDQLGLLQTIKDTIKGSKDVVESIATLMKQNNELSKQIEDFQRESLKIVKANLKSKVMMERGVNIIAERVEVDNAGLLKDLVFQLKAEIENLFLVIGADIDGKPMLTVMISDNVVADKDLHAGKIVREAGKEIKGGGGGQPFYATAGGKDVNGLQAAIEKARSFIRK
ncbi:alanine--tRNA ligase [Sunxiuqinia elliptica]|uniref:Alanine--tRNA ligase n=1 Tax=Sunxiuqinia elliptica TaxID=655355 RepID=A0A4R6H4T6_9BACT|nr:alanine--tRNA ligase [Sunxiuqinia elliptica]TDO03140.1 alanyl-tRNA synthetase [Sunxiuqinia elliptica]TDO59337.1 alanyl-tRNA synthetase [Sunxiuqinia elliptica]